VGWSDTQSGKPAAAVKKKKTYKVISQRPNVNLFIQWILLRKRKQDGKNKEDDDRGSPNSHHDTPLGHATVHCKVKKRDRKRMRVQTWQYERKRCK
jgi:hypothetical protein